MLLGAINNQLGNIGYMVAVEYVFYAFFALALLCIVAVLAGERLRAAKREAPARTVEWTTRGVCAVATAVSLVAIVALSTP